MRSFLQTLLMILIAVVLTGSLAIPHICLDDEGAAVKVEQQFKTSSADHPDNSKAGGDNCCVAHHCCFAKLIAPAQPVWKAAFVSKADLPMMDQSRPASLDPKGLDRPPKFFA